MTLAVSIELPNFASNIPEILALPECFANGGSEMRQAFVALFLLAAGTGLASVSFAQDNVAGVEPGIMRVLPGKSGPGSSVFGTANSNCIATTCDTVWVGHSNSGPGGAFLGVSVGGNWDFDTGVANTDSTQGWQRWTVAYTFGQSRAAIDRPEWALNYGNMINEGNTNLWSARDLAGRKYVKTGIAGAWHSSTLAGVKKKLSDGAEPSALPISGTRSAWCGLRESGNTLDQDALTGNYINGDLYNVAGLTGPNGSMPDFPGFCSLWDQMLYKDFPSSGTGTVAFRVRTDMSTFVDPPFTSGDGAGWFNPDPTSISNFVLDPADSFMVYVGSPNDAAYDTNRRWISEVLNYGNPIKEIFAVSGLFPFVAADTSLSLPYSGVATVGGNVRVVFRIKTNRARADGVVSTATSYNSKQGAAVLDDVQIDGGTIYGFESAGDITARSLAGNIALSGQPWVTTGKPPSAYFHVANISAILYEDLCGAVGASTRRCNLAGNVLVAGDADNGNQIPIESYNFVESPTVNVAVRTAAPGTKNTQGIDQQTASRPALALDYDFYSGFMNLDEAVFFRFGGRFYGPSATQVQSGNKVWSPWQLYPFIIYQPDPFCVRGSNGASADDITSLGIPAGQVDSIRVNLGTLTEGFAFGGINVGNTHGTYFDNVRLGFVRGEAPAISQEIWNKYQDQFPVNEAVTPGDNASFDTTTAYMKSGLNIVAPVAAKGTVAGDSITCNSVFVGDGITTGVRVDLIFRIDPGPGNYTVKGDRSSALVEKDVLHPFWATYKANNGPFGTPGGHGSTWNRNVWNSARMDSADANLYPIVSRSIGGPASPTWAGTLHESDPNYNTLGINHNLCFLLDPNGSVLNANLICDGSVPAPYSGVSGTTKENTKILPDGYFSPGTHIEYFIRRSLIQSPSTAVLLFDTTAVFPQDPVNTDFDQERWSNADVLPDMWKSTRYGGLGLACMLMIDGNDRRGADPAYRGAADSLGYGKNNGATQGWKRLGPKADTENPAGFVAANLGQYGLNFDHYDIRAAESGEAGHPGVRFVTGPGAIALKGDKSGPSASQLASLYTNVLYLAGDLNAGTLQDGFDTGEGANDIALLDGFLAGATPANRRGVWLSGDGIMEDGAINSDNGTKLLPFLENDFGSDLTATNYKLFSTLQIPQTVGFLPTAPWAHPGRVYGFNNVCVVLADVLQTVPTVNGATEGAQYQNSGPGPYTASIYRPTGASRDYRTLIDGFDISNLRGNYASLGQIATLPENDNGRLAWFDDAVSGHFQICARRGPVIGVGDLPGVEGGQFSNVYLGSFPNPAFAGRNITLRFTLAKAQDVTVRIYNVAGREVANFTRKGAVGPNSIIWDGAMSNGAKATAGVYFYAIDGIDFLKDASKGQKMILLGSNAE